MEERAGFLHKSRAAYVKSVGTCAANLRWKVWLGGARTELCHQQIETSQALLALILTLNPNLNPNPNPKPLALALPLTLPYP